MEQQLYSIVCREISKYTGEVAVYECMTGTQEKLSCEIFKFKMRSKFNPELSYYVCHKDNQEALIDILSDKNFKGCFESSRLNLLAKKIAVKL